MSTVTSTIGKFVWHEQVSDDPKQAQDFYTQLFGWDTEVFKPGEVDYTMISSGGQSHGGFGKAMEGAPPPHWLSHVHVENLDETIEKVKNAGWHARGRPVRHERGGTDGDRRRPAGRLFRDLRARRRLVRPRRASSSGTSWAPTTPRTRSASTSRSSAGRRATWVRSTAATGSSIRATPASRAS